MKPFLFVFALLVFFGGVAADTLVVHTGLECRAYLPDNWVVVEASDSQLCFYDTTWAFASQLSIVRHNRNAADFPTPEDWTRAFFIAYKVVVEYSAAPWGAVLYYDSSSTSKQGALWAPEIYTTFFDVDTLVGSWSEYSRFTASRDHGYELYALGDTTDMLTNLATYAAILQTIDIPGSDVAVEHQWQSIRPVVHDSRVETLPYLFDARGRRLGLSKILSGQVPDGAYFTLTRGGIVELK